MWISMAVVQEVDVILRRRSGSLNTPSTDTSLTPLYQYITFNAWGPIVNETRSPLLSANLRETPPPGSINPGQRAVYHDYNIYEQRIVFISTFLLSSCVDYKSRSTSVNPKVVDCCAITTFYFEMITRTFICTFYVSKFQTSISFN